MIWVTASEECVQVWRGKPKWSEKLGAFQGDCLFNIPKERWPWEIPEDFEDPCKADMVIRT